MASPAEGLYADSGKNMIVDYPQALQKAGVKKVRCIFRDSHKFTWIGTDIGLYRYDGTNIDLLQHDAANPHSLPNNTVVSITEDRRGYIWVGTLEGAAAIDPLTLSCQVYYARRNNLDQEYDIKIYVDPDGKMWAIGSHGLDYFDARQNKFVKAWKYGVKNKLNVGYANCITQWKKDTLVMGTFDGAVFINKNNFGFRRALAGKNLAVIRAFTDTRNRLWLGTWGLGCVVYDSNSQRTATIKIEEAKENEIGNVITGIINTNYGHDNTYWISTLRGVYKITNPSGNLESLENAPKKRVFTGYTSSILADDDQYIWEASNVVSRFFAGNSLFKPVPVDYSGSVQDIYPLNLGGEKSIAYLTWYAPSGLVITDHATNQVVYRQPSQSNQDDANIGGIAQDKYGRLWISSLGGVQVLDRHFKEVYNSDKITSPKDQLLSSKTNFLSIKNDTVWIACYKRGVDLYDLNFHKLKSFKPNDGSGLTDDYVQRIYTDNHGRLWLCGNNKLYLYSSLKSKFRSFNFNKDSTSFAVNDMAELPGGDLVVASAIGLYRMDTKTYAITRITSPLIDNSNVLAVSVDNNGDIWFINDEHLIYYQVKTHHFTLFGHEDGLNTSNGLQWLRFPDHKRIFLAADKQIVTFSPAGLTKISRSISLYFHDVEVNDSTLARGTFARGLKLDHNENRLNVGFGAINYIKPEQNLYAYQLSSVDDHWVYTSHNFVSYANLAPGSYKFSLKASNYAGVWSAPISMTVVVYPPFWATWWFRTLSFILVGSVLLIAVRYVLQRNLRERILKLEKEQAVERERNRIARDMHDDLGSGLTKIAILSEVAKTQISSPVHASANLDIISASSRELVDSLQDIIWVLNPKNDSLNSLELYIKEYTESFFEPAGIHYEFDSEGTGVQITLSEEQRRNIFLAVKESCNNILKHANCTKAGVNLKFRNNTLTISVKDNGLGFDLKEVGVFSNGLQNIRNRMNQIGASCHIVSAKNEGTWITLSIPV
ncbi:MAG TPA: two-component regulator propeller domain-containing protein [Mucilaginibacter sp.]|nr:two-component regulator propeller domain-containing protein [Mucilaginibacter sp.]